jgi:hypothetical protein
MAVYQSCFWSPAARLMRWTVYCRAGGGVPVCVCVWGVGGGGGGAAAARAQGREVGGAPRGTRVFSNMHGHAGYLPATPAVLTMPTAC